MNTVAIDFGTERTKLSYWDERRGEPRLMRIGRDEQPYLPSLFYLGQDGTKLLGIDAQDMLEDDPSGIVDVLKRRLRDSSIRRNRQRVTPSELLSLLLGSLRTRAGEELVSGTGKAVDAAVLTVPARYGPADSQITRSAALSAGFKDVVLVPEPVAAARAWLHEVGGQDENVVVFDCGGGTIDWAFLRRIEGDFRLDPDCPPGGDEKVGGHDIDEELFLLVKEYLEDKELHDALSTFVGERPRYVATLRQLKERYHRRGGAQALRVGQEKIKLTPEHFAEVTNRRFVEQAWQGLEAYLQKVKSSLEGERPKILLVGGSARLQGLRETIAERSGCDVVWWERSEYATVLGAAATRSAAGAKGVTESDGRKTTTPAVSQRRALGAETKKFIAHQKQVHDDFLHFLREYLIVQWRLSNSVNGSAFALMDYLNTIGDNEDSKSVSLKVRQGLESVSIAPFDQIVKECSSGFVDMVASFITDIPSRYIQLYPGLEPFRAKFAPPGEWKSGFVEEVSRELYGLRKDYETLKEYYEQLIEYYPRYNSIQSQSGGWLSWFVGGAAAAATAGVSLLAAGIWNGWRNMNDEDFMKNYTSAIQNFIDACGAFTESGERILVEHIQRINDVWNDAFKPLAELFVSLAEMGENLQEVEKHASVLDHAADFSSDLSVHQGAAIIISNLKEQSYVPKRALDNIIRELRSSGVLVTTSGELDEKAVAALPPDEGTALISDILSEIMAIIGRSSCCASDRFFVAPNIPESKLLNALRSYGYGCGSDDVLALYDDTFWGGGGDGFIVTLAGLLWSGPNAKAWNEIRRITKAAEGNAVKIDGVPISVVMASEQIPHFAAMLQELRECIIRTVDTQSGKEDSFFINGDPVAISTTDNGKAPSVFVKEVNAARKPSATQEKTRPSKSRASTARSGSKSAPDPSAILSLISQARDYAQAGSFDMAKSLFVKAAKLGSAEAMEEMANIWSRGLGCTKDPAAAERWRQKAEKARRERSAAGTSATGIDASQTKPQLLDSMTKAQLGDLAEAVGVSFTNSRITKSEMIDKLLSSRSLTKARLVEFLSA